eukprot:SAG31_NODE_123_length_23712_cov_41.426291_35_plen_71_part_00
MMGSSCATTSLLNMGLLNNSGSGSDSISVRCPDDPLDAGEASVSSEVVAAKASAQAAPSVYMRSGQTGDT